MLVWGRLLRLSLAPSAAADVAAGIVLGAALAGNGEARWLPGPGPWLLIAASLCVYHGAMALNDWADRAADARTRPERPIPSGSVPARAALSAGLGLLIAGPVIAWLACRAAGLTTEPVGLLGWIAVCALAYDLAGRGPTLGPALLGVCRAGNLGVGCLFAALSPVSAGATQGDPGALSRLQVLLVLVACYGLYVFVVSRLGRLEDAEDSRPLGRRPTRLLCGAAALLHLPVWGALFLADLAWPGAVAALLVSGLAAIGLVRLALGTETWTRPLVMASMGACLRRLLVFTATVALLAAALAPGRAPWIVAAAILAGYPVSHALRKVFPPS